MIIVYIIIKRLTWFMNRGLQLTKLVQTIIESNDKYAATLNAIKLTSYKYYMMQCKPFRFIKGLFQQGRNSNHPMRGDYYFGVE